jgi:hypothetical protein
MSRRLARVAAAILLAGALCGCQMTVRLVTHVDANGGGNVTISMRADKELRDQLLAASDARSGLGAVRGLFDELRAHGWTVTQSEPGGALLFAATRTFANRAGFEGALAELRSARDGDGAQLGGITLDLGYAVERSFLRTKTRFYGNFDTSGMKLDPSIASAIQGLVRFELRAELPGNTVVAGSEGSVAAGGAVWRPELGSSVVLSARSSALRTGSMLLILIPGLLLLIAFGWLAAVRRKPAHVARPAADEARTPRAQPVYKTFHPEQIDRTIVLEPSLVDEEPRAEV